MKQLSVTEYAKELGVNRSGGFVADKRKWIRVA